MIAPTFSEAMQNDAGAASRSSRGQEASIDSRRVAKPSHREALERAKEGGLVNVSLNSRKAFP
jgi:hypothetical protein